MTDDLHASLPVTVTISPGRLIVLTDTMAHHIHARTSGSTAMLTGDAAGRRVVDALCAAFGYYPEDPAWVVARDRIRELQAERAAAVADEYAAGYIDVGGDMDGVD